ncbi:MAG TPA: maleylpyruvate isomerase N-terminal domain-containing protein [Streptosporangiaceae bacterium]|nr:maleylpyruvate isomerase N-terminal domain-containing protein [Streptosporangiaceae bacterium]
MNPLSREHAEAAFDGAYVQLTDLAAGLDDAAMMRPSRCAGWSVGDVLYHQLLDARRALRTFATPGRGPADRDDVSYWRPFAADGEIPPGSAAAADHARHVRIVASAFSPAKLTWEWTETAEAARRAAKACPFQMVATQGHVLRAADFMATLAVEGAVHYLDMTAGLPGAAPCDPISLGLVTRVLDGLLGRERVASWDDETYALKGTGRIGLAEDERTELGPAAGKFPLFG